MSEFRQRAIEDVARELVVLPEIIERTCAKHEEDKTRWPEILIALLVARQERVLELEAAVLWALGYEMKDGSFRSREPGEGAYWWRDELQERAKVTPPRPSHEA